MRTGENSARKIIVFWCLFLVAYFVLSTLYSATVLRDAREAATVGHEMTLDQITAAPGKTEAEVRLFDLGREPMEHIVHTGIYVDRISDFSIRNSRWIVDFFVWFRWQGESIDPGNSFHMVNGMILDKRLGTSSERDGEHYELYHISAEITKPFDTGRFPLDDHLLTVRFEDSDMQFYDLLYVPDIDGSRVSSRVSIPGFEIYETVAAEKKHSYQTRRGDIRLPEDYKATYSQFIFGISIKRTGWALYTKMMLGIIASVAVAATAFVVSPEHTGPRFSLGIGGFFSAIASTYVISQKVPESSHIGLSDYVTGFSLITILLMLLTSSMSVHLFNRLNMKAETKMLDLAVLVIVVVGYILFNIFVSSAAAI